MQSTAARLLAGTGQLLKNKQTKTGVCLAAHEGSSLAFCIKSDTIQVMYVDV